MAEPKFDEEFWAGVRARADRIGAIPVREAIEACALADNGGGFFMRFIAMGLCPSCQGKGTTTLQIVLELPTATLDGTCLTCHGSGLWPPASWEDDDD